MCPLQRFYHSLLDQEISTQLFGLCLFFTEFCALCHLSTLFTVFLERNVLGPLLFLAVRNIGQTQQRRSHCFIVSELTVAGCPAWIAKHSDDILGFKKRSSIPLRGILQNRWLYIVCKAALCYGRFKYHKSLFYSKSVHGCYMLPLGLYPTARKSPASARTLSLGPRGQDVTLIIAVSVMTFRRCAKLQ